MHLEHIRQIKAQLWGEVAGWRADRPDPDRRDAVAVGVRRAADGSYGLAVRCRGDTPLARMVARRGRQLAGGECDVRDVGVIRPLQWEPDELQTRTRPLRPGLSVAHLDVTAGTIGAFVVPVDADGPVAALSNNHVLANSGQGMPGDVIVQPGPADGGVPPEDRIGALDRVAALRPVGSNLVDAATARLDAGIEVEPAHPAGALSGWADPDSDLAVEKAGRTTGLTRGQVSAIELDGVAVQYPGGVITFDGQIEVTGDGSGPFSAGGDSGSVVYDPLAREVVGLLFAGSERGGADGFGLTYCNPFGAVLDELGVRLLVEAGGTARDEARAAKDELRAQLGGDPRVGGVGITRSGGRYAVRVTVVDQDDVPEIPSRVLGVEVVVVAVGRIYPLSDDR